MPPSGERRRNPAASAAMFLFPAALLVIGTVAVINWPSPPPMVDTGPAAPAPSRLRVFIDASASMAGYFEGRTTFKDHLARIIADLPQIVGGTSPQLPRVSYVFARETDEPFTGTPDELITKILNGDVITGGSSMLQQVLARVITSLESDEVAIIITDGLFSYSNDEIKRRPEINRENIAGLAAQVQLLFQPANWVKKKMTPALAVLQYASGFNGIYYTYRNERLKCCAAPRPYYLWVLGDAGRVAGVFNAVRRTKGLEPRHSVLLGPLPATPRPRVLTYSRREGNWQPIRNNLLAIEKVSAPAQLTIAMDLAAYPDDVLTGEYVARHLDKQRLRTEFAAVELVDFGPRSAFAGQFHPRDNDALGGATHFLTVRVTHLAVGRAQVTVSVRNELPSWCTGTDTDDDSGVMDNVSEPKTFGFLSVIEGAARALRTGEPLFHFDLTLEQQ